MRLLYAQLTVCANYLMSEALPLYPSAGEAYTGIMNDDYQWNELT